MIFGTNTTSKSYPAITKIICSLVIALVFLGSVNIETAFAQVMSSGNFKVQSDSVNFAGARSSSATYTMEDTAGEIATGYSNSSTKNLHAGFQQSSTTAAVVATPTPTPVAGGSVGSSGSVYSSVNVSNFVATPEVKDILLSWEYPLLSNIVSVVIVRSDKFFPSSPNDGEIIFQGDTTQVIDHNVVPGTQYYYAIFARSAIGLYSSGVLAQARIIPQGETPPIKPVPPTNIFENIPIIENVHPAIKGLTLDDFDFIQDGRKIEHSGSSIAVDAHRNLTVQLAYNKVPEILKTIALTLTDPKDPTRIFTFLLRVNKDKTAYEATIGSLGQGGNYKISAVILDYKNQGLKKLNGDLRAMELGEIGNLFTLTDNSGLLSLMIILLILAFFTIVFFVTNHRRRRNIAVTILILALGFGSYTNFAKAAFNQQINYQGKLMDSTNNPVADGTYQIVFNLYTQSAGGSAVWTETWSGGNEIQVTNGLFSVMLGSLSSLASVDFNQTLYLGLTIESDSEMTPRKILGAVPAAFVAQNSITLNGLSSTDFVRVGAPIIAGTFTATSTTLASTFPYASTTAITVSGALFNTSLSDGCVQAVSGLLTSTGSNCGTGSGSGNTFGYLFPNNSTSTLLSFTNGILSTASTTIGAGGQTTGLTIFGGATTTLNAYFASSVGIGTTSPGTIFSIQGVGNFSAATSTLQSTGGFDLKGGGCYAINGNCVVDTNSGGTVTSVATNNGLSGGIITNTGTIGLDLSNLGSTNTLLTWNGSRLTATGTPTLTVGNIIASSTGNASVFPYASTTALTVAGINGLTLNSSFNGPLQANSGVVSATTSVGVLYGGTGLTSIASSSLLIGSTNNTFIPFATSSLGVALGDTTGTLSVSRGGTGQTSFTQGWLNSDGTTITSSTSPTVNYITATSTTATSTFAWGVQATKLNITSTTASSTFANGINLSNGCFAINGTCITNATGSTFAYPFPNNATSTLLTFSGGLLSTASTTIGNGNQNGGLTINGGATTTGNSYFASSIGIGTTTPGTVFSIQGVANFDGANSRIYSPLFAPNFTATSTTVASTFPYASTTALTVAGVNGLKLDSTLNGLLKATSGVVSAAILGTDYSNFGYPFPNNATSTKLTFSGGILSTASTTIGAGTDNTGLTINGGATTTGVAYFNGIVGIKNIPDPLYDLSVDGDINSDSTIHALGVAIGGNNGIYFQGSVNNGQINSVAGGLGVSFGGNQLIQVSDTTGNVGIGTTSPYAKLSIAGQAVAAYFTATSTTLASTFPYASTTALTVAGVNGLKLDSLNGPLQAINGVVSATSTLSVAYGGTGLSTYSPGDLVYATNPSTFTRLGIGGNGTCLTSNGTLPGWGSCGGGSGTSGGTWSTTTSQVVGQLINYPNNASDIVVVGGTSTSSAKYYFDPNSQVASLAGAVTVGGSLTISSLNGPLQANSGVVSATTSVGVLYGGTGLTSIASSSLLIGSTNNTFIPFATSSLGVALTDTTGTLSVSRGGTGQTSFTQGWLNSDGTTITSSTSPTVNYITATSTTATSTFAWGVQATKLNITSTTASSTFANGINLSNGCFAINGTCITNATGSTFAYPFPNNATSTLLTFSGGLLSTASTTIGAGAQATGLTINGGATTTGNAYFASNVGIGTTSPIAKLSVSSFNGGTQPQFIVASSTASGATSTSLIVDKFGNVGINTSNPIEKLDIYGATGNTSILVESTQASAVSKLVFQSLANTSGDYWGQIDFNGNGTDGSSIRASRQDIGGGGSESDLAFFTDGSVDNLTERMRISSEGLVGIGTTSPYAKLSVAGQTVAAYFTATTSTASTFPYASTTALTVSGTNGLTLNSSLNGLLKSTNGLISAAILGTDYSNFGYPFLNNATSTLLTFSGGLLSTASTTIGAGGQTTGLTINGGATTTGNAYFASNVGIGTTTPGTIFSIQGVGNFTTATSSFQSTGGFDLKNGGCFAISGTCMTSNTGTVTSVATNNGLTGGTITNSGTLGLDLSKLGTTNQNLLLTWNGSQLQATGTPTLAVGSIFASSTSIASIFRGGFISTASTTIGNGAQTGGLTISGGATTTGNAYFAGNVGIGTKNPTDSLDIENGAVKVGSNPQAVIVYDGTLTSGVNAGNFGIAATGASNGIGIQATNSYDVFLFNSNNNGIVLKDNGNVGIGTTTPYAPLSINGQTVALYYTATSTTQASTFPYASTTALTASGNIYAQGKLSIGASTTPSADLSIGNTGASTITIYSNATSTFGTGGINLRGGCYAINGNCVGSGTVTSIATNNGLTGGTITNSGTLGLDLSKLGTTNQNLLLTWNGSQLQATGTPTLAVGSIFASSTSIASIFRGGFISTASTTIGNGAQTGGLTISGGATTTGNAYIAGSLGVGTQPDSTFMVFANGATGGLQGVYGLSANNIGVQGETAGAANGIGVEGIALYGNSGHFSQQGTMFSSSAQPTLYAIRQNTLNGNDQTGAVLKVEDTTTSSGRLVDVIKSSVSKFVINNIGNVGVSTTTPYSPLAVWGVSNTSRIFEVVNSASTTSLWVSGQGNGTTTVTGLNINGSASSTSNVGINLTTGCFAINSNCVGTTSGTLTSIATNNGITGGTITNSGTLGLDLSKLGTTNQNLLLTWNGSQLQATGTPTLAVGNLVATSTVTASLLPLASTTAITVSGVNGLTLSSLGQGWVYTNGGVNSLNSSTSPTINYLVATSSTKASIFPYASTTALTVAGNLYSSLVSGCVQSVGGLLTSTGSGCGSGSGSNNSWSTTTSQVPSQYINYSNNNTDIVTIGGNSTSTAVFVFDPNIPNAQIPYASSTALSVTGTAYLPGFSIWKSNGTVGIGTNNPQAALDVNGNAQASNFITSGYVQSPTTYTNTIQVLNSGTDLTFNNSGSSELLRLADNGNIGIGTSTPGTALSIQGAANFSGGNSRIYSSLFAPNFISTSTTVASIFPYASTTALTVAGVNGLKLDSTLNGLLKATSGVVTTAILGTDYSNFAYPFPNNATSTKLTFSGGLLSTASTTIGAGTNSTGLTINGGATTTGNSYFASSIGVGTTTPGTVVSIQGVANLADVGSSFYSKVAAPIFTATSTTASSTFAWGVQADKFNATSATASSTFANGINLTNGCFSINSSCMTSNTGTVTSVATNNGLTGGTITNSGTLGLDLSKLGTTNQNLLLTWNGSQLQATGTPTLAVGSIFASSTSIASIFRGGFISTASTTIGNGVQAGGLTISGGATTTGNSYIAGSVGIGTQSSALGTLDVEGNIRVAGNPNAISFFDGTLASGVNAGTISMIGGGIGITATNNYDVYLYNTSGTGVRVANNGNVGIGTSTPGTALSIQGVANFDGANSRIYSSLFAPNFISTSTTVASIFPYASTTALTASGNIYAQGKLSIGASTTPSADLSIGNTGASTITIYSNATSTFGTGGINLRGGCYAVNGNCVGTTSGTVTSVATNNGLTGGTITNSGTLGLDLSKLGTTNQNLLLTWNGSQLQATGTPTLAVGNLVATSTTATSTFGWGVQADKFNATSVTASSTFANGINLTGGCFSINGSCVGTSVSSSGNTFSYPFPNNATSTKLTFSGGILSTASTTIGAGTDNTGLTINGGATTTGVAYFNGIVGIKNIPDPLYDLSVDGDINSDSTIHALGVAIGGNNGIYFQGSVNNGQINSVAGGLGVSFGGNQLIQVSDTTGNVGIGTTSPYAKLSIAGQAVAAYFTATSTTLASTFPYASTTALTASGNIYAQGKLSIGASTTPSADLSIGNTGASTITIYSNATSTFGTGGINLRGGCFAINGSCVGTSVSSSGNTFSYPFPNNATSTLLTFSGGLLSTASTTIGNGNQNGGLTINGGATTTGGLYVANTLRVGQNSAINGETVTFAGDLAFTNLSEVRFGDPNNGRVALWGSEGNFITLGTNSVKRITANAGGSGGSIDLSNESANLLATFQSDGTVGIGTTTPYAKLSVVGQTVAAYFTATTSTASTFPYASTTALTASGNIYAQGKLSIGASTTPSADLSIGNTGASTITIYSNATSTFGTGGINLRGGCYAVNGNCVGTTSGTVTSVATNNGLTGGTITTSGTLGLDLSKLGTTNQNLLLTWNGSQLQATGTPTLAVGSIFASSTSIASIFSGGILSIASTTIGAGTNSTGLTINGGATTTGNSYFASSIGVGTTTPGTVVSIQGVANLADVGSSFYSKVAAPIFTATSTTASSTFAWGVQADKFNATSATASSTFANGINLTGGCFSINSTCVSGSGGSGTVTSVATNNGLTGGTITNSGTLGLDLSKLGTTNQNLLLTWNGSQLQATGTPTLAVGSIFASSTSIASIFRGGFISTASTTIGNGAQTGGLTINGGATTTGNAYFAGNIGIGTKNPTDSLDIENGAVKVGSNPQAVIVYDGTLTSGVNAGNFGIAATGASSGLGIVSTANYDVFLYNASGSGIVLKDNGNVGIGTTTPGTALGIQGSANFGSSTSAIYSQLTVPIINATSTTATSTFAWGIQTTKLNITSSSASSTFANGINLTGGCFSINSTCIGTSVSSSGNTFSYPFPLDATSTKLTFSGGILSIASTTIGAGTNSTGLTINGGATTTGNSYFASSIGVGTTTPGTVVSIQGVANLADVGSSFYSKVAAPVFTATSTTASSTFAWGVSADKFNATSVSASSTFANGINLTGGCFSINSVCVNNNLASTFGYPFPNNATSTLLTFSGGLLSTASTTIGAGTNSTGLTINGGATTTGNAYFASNVGIGTSTPGTVFSIQGVANFDGASSRIYSPLFAPNYIATSTTASSTFAWGVQADKFNATSATASSTFANGINLTNGCFSINSSCMTSNTGTVTSVATNNGLTGGTITTSGTLGLDLSKLGTTNQNLLLTWNGSQLQATGTPTLAVGNLVATSTTATSTFGWGVQADKFNATSATASSTFANGINLTGGCFSINSTCVSGSGGSGTVTSVATNNGLTGGTITNSGTLGLDLSKLGTTNQNLLLTWNGSQLQATGTPTLAVGSIFASSTSIASIFSGGLLVNASSTIGAGTNSTGLTINGGATTTGNAYFASSVGVGTTTPGTIVSIQGVANLAGVASSFYSKVAAPIFTATSTTASSTFAWGIQADKFNATSVTASSTFANGINLTGGCFSINSVCVSGGTGGSGTVTSVATNNGLTGGTITGAGTIGLDLSKLGSTNTLLTWNGSQITATGTPNLTVGWINATSTNATSTFAGDIFVGSGVDTDSPVQVGVDTNAWTFGYKLSDKSFRIASSTDLATNVKVTLLKTGNFGIGDTSPDFALDVFGTICQDTDSNDTCDGTVSSDVRLKTNITPITNALDIVHQLSGVRFNWRQDIYPANQFGTTTQIGFVAQEVEKVLPEVIYHDAQGYDLLDYQKLTSVLANAVTELDDRVKFAVGNSTTTVSLFADNNGNIGIGNGTSTPTYKLQVAGDVAATGFVNISTITAKKDIEYVTDTQSIYNRVKTLNIAKYHYNEENSSDPMRLGLIAEESPSDILTASGKGVDLYKFSTFILGGLQQEIKITDALDKRVKSVEDRLAIAENLLASVGLSTSTSNVGGGSSGGSSVTNIFNISTSSPELASTTVAIIGSWFESMGVKIENGVSHFVGILADAITTKKLLVGDPDNLSASGVTILDRSTGKPVCFYISDGVTKTEQGECGTTQEPVSIPIVDSGNPGNSAGNPTSTTTSSTSTPSISNTSTSTPAITSTSTPESTVAVSTSTPSTPEVQTVNATSTTETVSTTQSTPTVTTTDTSTPTTPAVDPPPADSSAPASTPTEAPASSDTTAVAPTPATTP